MFCRGADNADLKITLNYCTIKQDFTYSDDYFEKWVANPEGANGPALEHHKFAHLDMNLSPVMRSGHFVLAKFLNEEKTSLAITGFKVSLSDDDYNEMMVSRCPPVTPSSPRPMCSTPITTSRAPGGQCSLTAWSMRENSSRITKCSDLLLNKINTQLFIWLH